MALRRPLRAASALLLLWSGIASAIDRIVIEADAVNVAGVTVEAPSIALDLSGNAPALAVSARRLALDEPQLEFHSVRIDCASAVIREPRFACLAAQVSARGGPTKAIDLRANALFDSAKGALELDGSGLAIAGGRLRFTGILGRTSWSARATAEELRLPQIRALLAPWLAVPAAISAEGTLGANIEASGHGGSARGRLVAHLPNLDLSNEEGSVVAEKVALRVRADARRTHTGLEIETTVDGTSGQALAGPVLLDFGVNPLSVAARGRLSQGTLRLDDVAVEQKDLLAARATASLRLAGDPPTVTSARAEITRLQFPAAYRSFLQIALAATDFGTLEAAGTARGAVEIADDALVRFDLSLEDIDLKDEKTQFFMDDLQGDIHWAPKVRAGVPDSTLAWSKTRAYGLSGGTARLDFRTQGDGFELTREVRLPVFDGAVLVHSLLARNLSGEAELAFDADIEPISMTLLSKAFGWPELAGQLSGRIPGLTYRNKVLALNGDVTAQVFDGTITGRNFRLQDPLGPWPRLFTDVTARRLDLQLVTSTFSIGTITGRMDADLAHLELFAWSPVAFDARLYSTPGDRSPRRISQKAVTSISSIGGGSGGVTKALQSGVLRFFEEFRYDRIGMECRLRNEVCLMSGIEPHREGYYLVKGRGLPRIDIIGNQGRVDWPRLLSQIVAGMRSNDVIVR